MPRPPTTADVAALLVSHDGARWLPQVLAGVEEAAPSVARLAVDTGSRDDSAALLREAGFDVVEATSATAYPAAVDLGLERLRTTAPDAEWVWLLHDDSSPAPGALDALLAVAARRPDVDVLGPKLREWPSLRRLLELGVTISGTGRRELGLEPGEFDQGQHDQERDVLAVNTAGMLVRRRVLEALDGFDAQLPMFGNDLDFGWRAAAAGHVTTVVPQAVVFHAEAAHRGVRRTPLTGRHTHYHERRAALFTLLANSPGRRLPLVAVRLVLGTLLRMVGFFVVRSPGEALDDLAALVSVYSQPGRVRAARRARATTAATAATAADSDETRARLRSLLAPWWLPYRHGLDTVGDLVSALTDQASDVAERRRAAAAELDPSSMAARRQAREASAFDVPEQDDEAWQAYAEPGRLARLVANPVALLLVLFVAAALLVARPAYGSVVGGALAPVPDAVGDWWALLTRSWHPLGSGTDVPAPAYLLPLALLGSVLGPTLAVSAVMVLAVPLALWGAWRFLRVAGRFVSPRGAPRWLLLIASTTYALVPLTSGAWGQGRLGLVVVAVALPWLAHAALAFADPEPDRRWRAAWRTGLLLALAVAFAPLLWILALTLAATSLLAAALVVRGALRDRAAWGPPATALAVVPVLLLPWWLPALTSGAGRALLLETGRPPSAEVGPLDLVLGRLDGAGSPAWAGALLVLAALLALVPRATRVPVLGCWVIATVVTAVGVALTRVRLDLPAVGSEAGVGSAVLVLQAVLVTAALLGGVGLARSRAARRPVLVAVAAVAAVLPLTGLVWAVTDDGGELASSEEDDVPAYMVQRAETASARGVLVARGSLEEGYTYRVLRGDGDTLGENEILALSPEDAGLTTVVQELVSRPTPDVVADLAAAGVQYVVLPEPADGGVAAGLDATGGLTQASAENRSTRAWELIGDPAADAVAAPDDHRGWWRVVLLVVQAAAVVVVAVLCAPTVRRRRP